MEIAQYTLVWGEGWRRILVVIIKVLSKRQQKGPAWGTVAGVALQLPQAGDQDCHHFFGFNIFFMSSAWLNCSKVRQQRGKNNYSVNLPTIIIKTTNEIYIKSMRTNSIAFILVIEMSSPRLDDSQVSLYPKRDFNLK